MKKILILCMMIACVFTLTSAALAQDDVAKQASCKYCGMDRKTFAHSRMLVEL